MPALAEVVRPAPRHHAGPVLLAALGLGLLLAGLVVLAVGASGRFLPHDEAFLGMTAAELCALHGCRVVHFMVHDRVSFGGAVAAVGLVYLWLAGGPLRRGEGWAWWAFLTSGTVGFASFFAYLGYGYLDPWHGLATLGLFPCFLLGLYQGRCTSPPPPHPPLDLGRGLLLFASAGLAAGGLVILLLGMTSVFVPEDLAYMGVEAAELRALNPRLVPLIAHDRAAFGGAVCAWGVALFFAVRCAAPSRGLWVLLALAGAVGFVPAIVIHPLVGYDDPWHLAPAVLGALVYSAGLARTFRPMWPSRKEQP